MADVTYEKQDETTLAQVTTETRTQTYTLAQIQANIDSLTELLVPWNDLKAQALRLNVKAPEEVKVAPAEEAVVEEAVVE